MAEVDDLLIEISPVIEGVLCDRFGLNENDAREAANMIYDGLRQLWAGQMIYMKKIPENRDEKIVSEFNGRNHRALCRKYGIGLPRLYQIVQGSRKVG